MTKKGMKRVEGYNNLYRNDTGAIVNTDDAGYRAYKAKRDALQLSKEHVSALGDDLKSAQAEIKELKELIKQLINK